MRVWLAQHGVAAAANDYVGVAANATGVETLIYWNTAVLGAQPTTQQLQALVPVWQNQQKAKQFGAVVAAGVALTSSGTPALKARYYADEGAQGKLTGIVAGIGAGQGLPGGGATFSYLDMAGLPHSFTADQITGLARCVRDFIYGATITRATLQAGVGADWPSNGCTLP